MSNDPIKKPPFRHIIALGELNAADKTGFDITPASSELRLIADFLGIRQAKKLRFSGQLSAQGAGDWLLEGRLGASIVQACVITGAPVATRIDTDVCRLLRKNWSEATAQSEAQFDGDTESEPLGNDIDLGQMMTESLALALPDYPRAKNAELSQSVFCAPNTAPLRASDMKPFASLAKLRDKLSK